jgi:hypothetical protein
MAKKIIEQGVLATPFAKFCNELLSDRSQNHKWLTPLQQCIDRSRPFSQSTVVALLGRDLLQLPTTFHQIGDPNFWRDMLIHQWGRPQYVRSASIARFKYTSNTHPMFVDVIPLDKCLYISQLATGFESSPSELPAAPLLKRLAAIVQLNIQPYNNVVFKALKADDNVRVSTRTELAPSVQQ